MGERIDSVDPLPVTVIELPLTTLLTDVPPTNTSLATETTPPLRITRALSFPSEPTRSLLVIVQTVPASDTVPVLRTEPALRPKRALAFETWAPPVATNELAVPLRPITRAAWLEKVPPVTTMLLPPAAASSPTTTSLAPPVTVSVPLVTRKELPFETRPTVRDPGFVHRPPDVTDTTLPSAPAS